MAKPEYNFSAGSNVIVIIGNSVREGIISETRYIEQVNGSTKTELDVKSANPHGGYDLHCFAIDNNNDLLPYGLFAKDHDALHDWIVENFIPFNFHSIEHNGGSVSASPTPRESIKSECLRRISEAFEPTSLGHLVPSDYCRHRYQPGASFSLYEKKTNTGLDVELNAPEDHWVWQALKIALDAPVV